MNFEFATAGRIIFGPGTLMQAGDIAAGFGGKAFVVAGPSAERNTPLIDSLHSAGMHTVTFTRSGEPTTDEANAAAAHARSAGCDVVIGFGGGSSIDLAKAVSALIANEGDLFDYLEVVGKGNKLANQAAPCIAIPTTAGTGAETTRNAVLMSPGHRVKVSLRSASMLPDVAIVDPELTYSVPPDITAATGLDALTQLIEAYVTKYANPLTGALCQEGIPRAARSLRRAFLDGSDVEAREDMSIAALFSGIALANAKLGAVHGIAGPFGGMFPDAPHGAVCGRLLPEVVDVNVRALSAREPDNPALARFDELATLLTGDPESNASDAVKWIAALCRDFNLPGLGSYGASGADVTAIVEKAGRSSSMKGNPITLTTDETAEIISRCI